MLLLLEPNIKWKNSNYFCFYFDSINLTLEILLYYIEVEIGVTASDFKLIPGLIMHCIHASVRITQQGKLLFNSKMKGVNFVNIQRGLLTPKKKKKYNEKKDKMSYFHSEGYS